MTKIVSIEGLPVVDAKKPLRLEVISSDIKGASLKKPNSCAVARACKRALNVPEVRVHLSRVYLLQRDHWLRYMAPVNMRAEIVAFDRGGAFEPGEFKLLPPTKSARLGARNGGPDENATRGNGKKRRKFHRIANVRAMPVMSMS